MATTTTTLLGTLLQKIGSANLNSFFILSTNTASAPGVNNDDDNDDDQIVENEDQIENHVVNNQASEKVSLQRQQRLNSESLLLQSSIDLQQQQQQQPLVDSSNYSQGQNNSEPGETRVLRNRFYWSNLVLDTNHYRDPSDSLQDYNPNDYFTNNKITTRSQSQFRQNQAKNGKIVASSSSSSSSTKTYISKSNRSKSSNFALANHCSLKMGAIKFLGCSNSSNKNRKGRLAKSIASATTTTNNANASVNKNIKSGVCKCFTITGNLTSSSSSTNNNETGGKECVCNLTICCSGTDGENFILKKKTYCYHEAPHYLKFNPHITGGYRGMLRPIECVKSLFWWTNETMNIWTHLFGWFFFLALSIYDFLGLLDLPNIQPLDQLMLTGLLLCFQACMLLSSLYHIFCCHSEVSYRRWLSADLLGVSLSLLAIYVSGIYYAFSCVPSWLNFYLVTVGAIFATAMIMQILPIISKKEMVTEERFRWRLIVFGGWAAYGVIPTLHWAYLHGMSGPAVSLLLPRILGVYILSGFAFFFYVTRIPEKLWPGLVNFVGSSHQIWHILIVAALYHWHNTGMLYLQFRAAHPCSEEYEYLFGVQQEEKEIVVVETFS